MSEEHSLGAILKAIGIEIRQDLADIKVKGVSFLPSEIDEETIGVGIRDWHGDYHEKVLQSKAKVVIVDRQAVANEKVIFQVDNANKALSRLSAEIEGRPADKFPIIGITGTNGKTTITTLVESALIAKGWKIGRLGTLGACIAGETYPLTRTTPNPPELHRLLSIMKGKDCDAAVMEVGSFGLKAHRVDDVGFHIGVFTNLTRDHLDVHKTMEVYAAAKARLFECLRPEGNFPRALLCADDPNWKKMNPPKDHLTYGFYKHADLQLSDSKFTIQNSIAQLNTPFGSAKIKCQMPGKYNLQNMAAAIGILLSLDIPLGEACKLVENAELPTGRSEFIPNNQGMNLVIDYAHTPDGLEKILGALRPHTVGHLWVMFGCGGFRDEGKRAQMGKSAETLADKVVLTSDNSRDEDPKEIIEDILLGMKTQPVHIEINRKEAIKWVINQAKTNDSILFAGMGHERTQIVGSQEIYFNEKEIIQNALKNISK